MADVALADDSVTRSADRTGVRRVPPVSPPADRDIALAVDLDGTLCRTDTLQEAVLSLAATSPLTLLRVPGWLLGGRAHLKERLADRCVLAGDSLPLEPRVIEAVREARAAGRKTVLISAADQRQVEAVAAATGLFDEAIGSRDGRNLKGEAKAALLVERFGRGGYDYMGDAAADLPVWGAARRSIPVGAGPGLLGRVRRVSADVAPIPACGNRTRAVLKALRPHQWSKNLLLFLPMGAAHDFSALPLVGVAFLAFCMMASSAYLLNDLLDLAADRAHPRKRNRPFASGALAPLTGVGLTAGLVAGALALVALTGSLMLAAVLLAYLAATLTYSFWLKRKSIVDVLVLAGLYTVRIVAGGVAAGIVLSPWMLGFSMFLFLALAAIKRQAELVDSIETNREVAGRGYVADDLPIVRGIALSATNGAIVVLSLYISSPDVQALYASPELIWGICPLLLYWLYRMVMKAHRGEMSDDPIVFAATDRISLSIVLACAAIAFAASS